MPLARPSIRAQPGEVRREGRQVTAAAPLTHGLTPTALSSVKLPDRQSLATSLSNPCSPSFLSSQTGFSVPKGFAWTLFPAGSRSSTHSFPKYLGPLTLCQAQRRKQRLCPQGAYILVGICTKNSSPCSACLSNSSPSFENGSSSTCSEKPSLTIPVLRD